MKTNIKKDYYKILAEKISKVDTKICILGMGYVGLPLAVEFAKKGYFVYGFDTSASRIEHLKTGERYIVDIDPKDVLKLIKKEKFLPTTDETVLKDSDVAIVCVPTPLRKVKIPDISYVVNASKTIKKYLKHGQLIILESTSYPTTTRETVLPILQQTGLKEEKDFFLCFSPERVNPGDKKFPITKITKVVGGLSPKSGNLTKELYAKIIEKVYMVSSPEVAETSKLLENTFRLVNIALINEFAMVCSKLGISVWEVIESAKTKPFGFMPFYPGPGIGGHCLGGKEIVIVKDKKGRESLKTFEELFAVVNNNGCLRHSIKGADYIKPNHFQILSFDMGEKKPIFKSIDILTKRKYKGKAFQIITNDYRRITLTEMHPLIIKKGDSFGIKWAKDLQEGDEIPFISKVIQDKQTYLQEISLLAELSRFEFSDRIRVKPKNFKWVDFKDKIDKLGIASEKKRDYLRGNFLPYQYFKELECKNLIKVNHEDFLLCSGRGPSYKELSAVINMDKHFWRLIGYYLSEGCITRDKSYRVRFTFNSEEKECIADILSILARMELKYSIYKSKIWKSLCIKVSSDILGFFFKDVLGCGHDSYTMKIPDALFSQPIEHKIELLKGIFRGDGGVDFATGRRKYVKNGREYWQRLNNASINYFSISNTLFQQVIYLLQSLGIIPSFKKRQNLLLITGYQQLKKFTDVFLDNKKEKLLKYLNMHVKNIPNRSFSDHGSFAVSKVKTIKPVDLDYVYSAEVKETNTFVTSYGTIVHNCIPCDPVYLSWKAKKLGFKTRMIDIASYINRFMPVYVVNKTEELLKEKNISIKNAGILVLGVAYKKDVKDLRESPALEIIEELQRRNSAIAYHDPFIPFLKINGLDFKSVDLTESSLKRYNCILLITDHTSVNYDFIRKNSALIFDTRNVYKKDYDNIRQL